MDRAHTGFANILARYGSDAAAPSSTSTSSASPKKASGKASPSKPV
jgi:hypothetical protein